MLNAFLGSAEALSSMGPELRDCWATAVRRLRPDLDLNDTEPLLSTWADDPLARGAYSARAAGAPADDAELLARPVGDLHFAGEYADPDFPGLMEGAIRSGERAADELVGSLTTAD